MTQLGFCLIGPDNHKQRVQLNAIYCAYSNDACDLVGYDTMKSNNCH